MPYVNQNRQPAGTARAVKPGSLEKVKMPAPVRIPVPSTAKG
jgi:hypothetical protein